MRAPYVLISIALALTIAGVASAQNAPCRECDADGDGVVDNSYHSVDVGAVVEDEAGDVMDEVLVDTDMAHSHDNHEKGFWLWFALCISAFLQHVEDALGLHTDVDANVEVYAESNGVDVDASLVGTQALCAEIGVEEDCELDFDGSAVGHLDGESWKAIATVEQTTGADVFVPAALPDTGESSTDVCVTAELGVCG